MFADYQMQQMSEQIIDQFGFSADDFHDARDEDDEDEDDDVEERGHQPTSKRFNDINFTGGFDEDAQQTRGDIFEAVCKERMSGVEDDDEAANDEDVWEGKTKNIQFNDANNESSDNVSLEKKDDVEVRTDAPLKLRDL